MVLYKISLARKIQAPVESTADAKSRLSSSLKAHLNKIHLLSPETARFSKLLQLPEGADIGKAINDAMRGHRS